MEVIMAKKKINCKDGLSWQEEMQARKIREKLENNDVNTLKELNELYLKWCYSPNVDFLQWLKLNGQMVWFSALKRIKNWMLYIG